MKAIIIVAHAAGGSGRRLKIDIIGPDGKRRATDIDAGHESDPGAAAAKALSYAADYAVHGYSIVGPANVIEQIPPDARSREATAT